jgi:hypothetical protein
VTQRGHLRFVGGKVYCPYVGRRVSVGADHEYGSEFVCPGCWIRVDATVRYVRSRGGTS